MFIIVKRMQCQTLAILEVVVNDSPDTKVLLVAAVGAKETEVADV